MAEVERGLHAQVLPRLGSCTITALPALPDRRRMTRCSRSMTVAIAGLSGCWSGPPAELPVRTSPAPLAACGDHAEEARRLPELVLDSPVRSSSDDEALNLRAQCRQEAPVTRSYRFTPPQTATYRLRLRADEPSAL